MLQVENVFASGWSDKVKVMTQRFEAEEGDFLTILNVFNVFKKFGMKRNWCKSNALRYKALKRAYDLREQLDKTLRRLNVPLVTSSDQDTVLKCIVSGLFPNAAHLQHSGEYKSIRGDVPLRVHPTCVLFTEKHLPCLVYNEINHTKLVYMLDVTAIDPVCLEVLAPHFYQNRSRAEGQF